RSGRCRATWPSSSIRASCTRTRHTGCFTISRLAACPFPVFGTIRVYTRVIARAWEGHRARLGSEIPPRVEPVEVLEPPIPDVHAVVHVGDHDVLDPVVGLLLRGLHRGAGADDDQHDAGRAGDDPLVVDLLDVFDMDAITGGFLEDDDRVLGRLGDGLRVGVRERRDHDPDTDLEAAARLERGERALGEAIKELADRSEHPLLLDTDRRIAEP